ncbi:hypothetical protein GCM10007160_18140 [Litchfieldella qijiaojingensis]|uniref:Poly A polymerase head domain-containing protein n=1 Tax=Litchfieldella qijiaojingensis TaxID=980347 RepID=A0ABQ2YQV8_9GAMM|nr:hypothetical protein [Halomonas qijiaojingensis]GGX91040.1 hypothetical protein GCM10007160_18140 [Halomonas qijiaojingensis]
MFLDTTCPTCGGLIVGDPFRDNLSRKEHRIQGMCQRCQDSVFESGIHKNYILEGLKPTDLPGEWVEVRNRLEHILWFCTHKVFIAGGCLRDLRAGQKDQVRDVDLWVQIDPNRLQISREYVKAYGIPLNEPSSITCYGPSAEDRGVVGIDYFEENGIEFNLIWMGKLCDSPETLIHGFDFGINQAAYDGDNFTVTDSFLEDHANQTITRVRRTDTEKRMAERAERMKAKFPGYRLVG